MKKVLVAGATGYLGKYIVNELKSRGYWVRVLIRKGSQKKLFTNVDDFFVGEITKPQTLIGIAENIDWVFSTIGITRQKDGLTYMDVDYQGNVNLLYEAEKSGVEKFEYISAINGDKQRHLKIFEAKELQHFQTFPNLLNLPQKNLEKGCSLQYYRFLWLLLRCQDWLLLVSSLSFFL